MKPNQQHWDKVYSEKTPTEVSWYEPMPEVSLDLVKGLDLPKDAAIIDMGGGDSFFAEFLLAMGYTDITVVDISSKAIERAKERMCEKAEGITWIVADAADFDPPKQYDLWHDRATFHFLTAQEKKTKYLKNLTEAVKPGGHVILATFSENGPEKCSGLQVERYSVAQLSGLFQENFSILSGKNVDHITPSGAKQNFSFCCFQRK